MTVAELKEALKEYPPHYSVVFFNCDDREGSPYYDIAMTERYKNTEGIPCCVLTDNPEGVRRF